MAYIINGIVYTDHPLMDEMVYHLGIIMNRIEIKDEHLALLHETETSITLSETYLSIKAGTISFDTFPFTQDLLLAFGYPTKKAYNYSVDRNLIPETERHDVFVFCCNKFIETYKETNNYYRALMGLPWIEEGEPEDEYFVYIDDSYVPNEPYLEGVIDFSKPLHEYTNYQIAVLTYTEAFNRIYKEYTGLKYKYLHFLGDTRLDLYDVRRAAKWDIVYMPSVELTVSDRFKQLYNINRTLYLNRFDSEAYAYASDYYDEFFIILLLCQTYTDMIADIPEWYVRRDVFDLRTCQLFLESHGIEFYKEIPLKYQIRLVKNMNKLIRFKSTNKNIWDIINLFDIGDSIVYKYYLFKKRIANETGSYATGKDGKGEYGLEFVKAPLGKSYDDTIKDNIYRTPYDDITYQDKYWDGLDTHKNVYDAHMAKDFTIEGTKYMSLENRVDLKNYASQVEFFYGLLLDSDMELGDITISIPTISHLVSLPLSDIFLLLYCMSALYEGYQLKIKIPTNMRYEPKPEFTPYDDFNGGFVDTLESEDVNGATPNVENKFRMPVNGGMGVDYTELTQESFHDWLRHYYPYLWTDMSERIVGFNMKADLKELQELVGFRHSMFQFNRGYTLEELGVSNFMAIRNINSIDVLLQVFKTNMKIHDDLVYKIAHKQTRDELVVLQFVYDYLFTRKFDYERYTLKSTGELATTYDEILREKNYIIYKYYQTMLNETDLETRQEMIRSAMNDIINTLDYYLKGDYFKYIFNIFTVTSFTSLLNYMYKVINFFKSWKVYFLEVYSTFNTTNKLDNQIQMADNITEMNYNFIYPDKMCSRDSMTINTHHLIEETSFRDHFIEILEFYEKYDEDPRVDMDADGGGVLSELEDNGLDIFNVSKEYDDLRELDGGGIDIESHSPYHMFNGGTEGSGMQLDDLDGGGAIDQLSYIDLNGENANPIMPEFRPSFDYSFSIDAGKASMRFYLTKTMIVRIVDNQIRLDIRLHDRKYDYNYYNDGVPNCIQRNMDGLYVEDIYLDNKEYAIIKNDIENFTLKIFDAYERAKSIPSNRVLNSIVSALVHEYIDSVLDFKKYAQDKVDELRKNFEYDYKHEYPLFNWGTF